MFFFLALGNFVIIPSKSLSPEALSAIVEEFITREGTDYGESELSLAQKVSNLLKLIQSGEVVIVYDDHLESVNLVPKEHVSGSNKAL